MNKKVSPKLKKLVREAFQRHAWNMNVSQYLADIHYMENDERVDGYDTHADITVDRRYLKVTLRVYPKFIKNWKEIGDTYIDETIAHETAHILTQHMMDLVTSTYKDEGETKDAWESLTETISRISVALSKKIKK